ncbi:MAG TPA: ice-binding family protein [Candidatus Acidoferrum sp.]|nr:ice-binding family protein [Candidatus Acidoferrum sp.]
MRLRNFSVLVLVFVLPLLAVSAYADTPGILSAGPFAVLGAAGVTNTGPSVITGNLAGSLGTPAITGFPPGIVNGAILPLGAPASVFTDASGAYGLAAGLPFTSNLSGQNLGGMTLTPGVYFFSSTAQLTGALTLNALGSNTAQWTFQIGSALTTASASSVQLINAGAPGAFGGGITWQVVSAATLGTTTTFLGTIISNAGIVLQTGATMGCGRAISLAASVTLDTNNISNGCLVSSSGTVTPPTPISAPEPGTFGLLSVGLAIGLLKLRKLS